MHNDKLYLLLKKYLSLEGYRLNTKELRLQLLGHPSYPSLHSVTGVLSHFGIDNAALKLSINKTTLEHLPTNRFLSTTSNSNEFVIVTKNTQGIVLNTLSGDANSLSTEDFLSIWTGIVVVIDNESDFTSIKSYNNSWVVQFSPILILVLMIVVFFSAIPNLIQSIHFILSIIGLTISYLILRQEIGYQSLVLDKICIQNESNNCKAVLGSKGSIVFKLLKISDLAAIFFLGLVMSWIIGMWVTNSIFPYLWSVSIISLPVTIYSIYYQKWVLKKWCLLCLCIVFTLWLQGITFLFVDIDLLDFSLRSFILSIFIGFLCTFSWTLFRKITVDLKEFDEIKVSYNKFKRNFKIFNSIFQTKPAISTKIEFTDSNEILLGNPLAPIQILLVTNPQCSYCKKAHEELEEIYHQNLEKVALTIRFNIDTNHKNKQAYKVSKRLLELFKENKETCYNSLNEVFKDSTNLDLWLSKWGESNSVTFDVLLNKQKDWCLENNIDFTPAVFINGRKFPEEYERTDFLYFVEELIETIKKI